MNLPSPRHVLVLSLGVAVLGGGALAAFQALSPRSDREETAQAALLGRPGAGPSTATTSETAERRLLLDGLEQPAPPPSPAASSALPECPPADDHARADCFWALVRVEGMDAEVFGSLEEAARSADLVVVGRITEVTKGREWVANPAYLDIPELADVAYARFATAWIEPEAVLGSPRVPVQRDRVPLELDLLQADLLPELVANVPRERAIFFLRDKADHGAAAGEYFRFTNVNQGLIREFDGRVETLQTGPDQFLSQLRGQPFGDVIARLKAILTAP